MLSLHLVESPAAAKKVVCLGYAMGFILLSSH